ncbi:hypothetical protein L6164_026988 [Bauhinia variegata]|uniref:Uncharacterized protein n=1 Tax=Bauhinia variegata TaxID=167791 RepID=A0ACB9LTA2_BAUVA|nr:hypothetical protein L6164_026988 [Bauhinia variegata]
MGTVRTWDCERGPLYLRFYAPCAGIIILCSSPPLFAVLTRVHVDIPRRCAGGRRRRTLLFKSQSRFFCEIS